MIDDLEQEKIEIGEQFNNMELDAEKVKGLGIRIKEIDDEIAIKTNRWMELAEFV